MAEVAAPPREEVEAAAAELLGDNEPEFKCEVCGKSTDTEGRPFRSARAVSMHKRFHKGEKAPAQPRALASEGAVKAVVEESVANAIVIGGYLAMVLPHLGIAIAGVPSDDPQAPIVRSRAAMAGGVLLEHARRNPRVLNALERFNSLFTSTELVEVVAGVGAAAAVDVGLVDAHLAVEVGPFRGESAIRPVQAIIGDVIGYVDAARAEQAAANGAASYPQPDEHPVAARGRPLRVDGDVAST